MQSLKDISISLRPLWTKVLDHVSACPVTSRTDQSPALGTSPTPPGEAQPLLPSGPHHILGAYNFSLNLVLNTPSKFYSYFIQAKTEFEKVKKFSVISQFKRKKKNISHGAADRNRSKKTVPGWSYPQVVTFPSRSPSPGHRRGRREGPNSRGGSRGKEDGGSGPCLGRPRANKQVGDFRWQQI